MLILLMIGNLNIRSVVTSSDLTFIKIHQLVQKL